MTGSGVRAAEMVEPGRLRVTSFPMPDPGPGAAVLRIHYAGICGTDRHTWRGESLIEAGAFCGAGAVPVDPNLACVKGVAVLGVGGVVSIEHEDPSFASNEEAILCSLENLRAVLGS